MVEWWDPPSPSRVIFIPCDGSHPPLQCGILDLLRVDPSGVFSARVHPHWMVSVLERLDAPSKENLQKIHASHPVADELDYTLYQHLNLSLLLRDHLQRGRLAHSTHGERRESSRLPWRRLVLAVEPGRLPPSDRLRKDHGWKGTFTPHLDSKTPAHLDHLCSLVTRIGLFHHLGATGEDVFEKAPMRPATQKILTQGHESSEIHDRVGCEVVELCPKEVQKSPKERIRQ